MRVCFPSTAADAVSGRYIQEFWERQYPVGRYQGNQRHVIPCGPASIKEVAMMSFVIDRSTKYRPLLSLFLLCFVDVVAAESQFVTVNDPRPVAQAARELESKFGLPITYEDPPYVHASEIADVTAQVRRDQQNHRKVWVPRGGTLSLAYDLPSEQIEAPGTDASAALGVAAAAAIAALVRTDSASRGAQMF